MPIKHSIKWHLNDRMVKQTIDKAEAGEVLYAWELIDALEIHFATHVETGSTNVHVEMACCRRSKTDPLSKLMPTQN